MGKQVTFTDAPTEMAAPTNPLMAPAGDDSKRKREEPPIASRRKALEKSLGVDLPALGSQSTTALFQHPFVGITNLGATCYMNSLLQTLFTTPELRQHIISFPFDVKQRHSRNVAFHLQLLFARMQQRGSRNFVDPKELVDSFGMGNDAHREQHDVQELNRVLTDVLQEFIDRRCRHLQETSQGETQLAIGSGRSEQIIRNLYEGKTLDVIRCLNCGRRRVSSAPFLDIVLPLCSMMGEAYDAAEGIRCDTLEDCLERFVGKEVIDGVECEGCGGRHQVEKYQSFDVLELPRILTIQLLRIQYNIETGRRDKVQKDIALPTTIDLRKWSSLPQGECEEKEAGAVSDYTLHAIICHRGTAYHGHYYVFVQCFPDGPGNPSRWAKFDDETVTWVSNDEVLEYVDPAQWKRGQQHGSDERKQDHSAKCEGGSEGADLTDAIIPLDLDLIDTTHGCEGHPPSPPMNVSPTDISNNDVNKNHEPFNEHFGADETIGSLLGDEDNGCASTAKSGCRTSALKTVSGQSYYLIYRRSDLPRITGDEAFSLPEYVSELLAPECTKREAEISQLLEIATTTSISFWFGDVDRALTSDFRYGQKVAQDGITAPLPYAMTQFWIEAKWDWTVRELVNAIRSRLGEETQLSDDSLWVDLVLTDEDSWATELDIMLRLYNPTLGVMGESLEDFSAPISAFCSANRSAVTHLCLGSRSSSASCTVQRHELDDNFADTMYNTNKIGSSKLEKRFQKFDNPFLVHIQSMHDPAVFPVSLTLVIGVPHGTKVETLKRLAIHAARRCLLPGDAADFPLEHEQVLTAVVNGNCVVRTTGVIIGDSFYIERLDPSRIVGNLPTHRADEDDVSFIVDSETGIMIHRSRGAESHAMLYFTEVEFLLVPQELEDSRIADFVRVSGIAFYQSMRIDRRTTLRKLKSMLLRKFELLPKDAPADVIKATEAQFQLWSDKALAEQKNLDTSVYVATLGAQVSRFFIVPRPVVEEGHFIAEVHMMRSPIDHGDPTFMLKRVSIGPDTHIHQVMRQVLPASDDEINFALIRPRLLPAGKTFGFGVPMINDIVKNNMTREHFCAGEILPRIVLQRISEPEVLEKGSLVLHVHYWNACCEDVSQCLGPEHEIVIHKELLASALRDMLSEMFSIPEDELLAAPARMYLLDSHNTAYNKVAWDVLKDGKVLSKAVAATPLALQMDDIIVVRRQSDPWPFVSAASKEVGFLQIVHGGGRSTAQQFKKTRAKSPATTGQQDQQATGRSDVPSTSTNTAKKARSETGITIRAVWDFDDEATTQLDLPAQDDAVGNGGSLLDDAKPSTSKSAAGSDAHTNQNELLSSEAGSAVPTSAVNYSDFLEVHSFSVRKHKVLAESCKICYEEFAEDEKINVLECGDVFHVACLAPWLRDHVTCPLCKLSILS